MSEELIQVVLDEAGEKMEKSVNHTKEEFAGVRTGRASTALVDKLMVNYHGAAVPLQQLAGLSVPEAQSLLISPYDPSSIEAIEKSIHETDLGLSASNDGGVIRLNFPPLTEDRRKELAKIVRAMAEEGKVAVRNSRRTARNDLVQLNKDGEISEDDLQRSEHDLDSLTHEKEKEIEGALEAKEKELLET